MIFVTYLLVNNQIIIAEKDKNRRKGQKKNTQTTLFQNLFQKISIEEIYQWIQAGYETLFQETDKIVSSFVKCGYIEGERIGSGDIVNEMEIENVVDRENESINIEDKENPIKEEINNSSIDEDSNEIDFLIEGIDDIIIEENSDVKDERLIVGQEDTIMEIEMEK